jgi:uncharacterized damage-inducible protein DinB
MKELFQQYAAYNIWANKLLTDRIKMLSEEEINKEIASSFPSLYKTAQHMWLAEEVWWKRHRLVENIVLESESFINSFEELANQWSKQSALWKEWIDNCTETQLQHVFAYVRNKQEEKLPTYQMILHVFNHATYHRGQFITLLRQLNADKLPATDFSAYCRTKKAN